MRVYTVYDGRLATDHTTVGLARAATVPVWRRCVREWNNCTDEELREQCRIIVLARERGLSI